MANYYTSLCVSLKMSEDAFQYLSDLNDAVNALSYDEDPLDVASQEIADVARSIFVETDCTSGCDISYEDGATILSDNECAQIDTVGAILHATWKAFDLKEPAVVEYANTCSQHRADAFGGGVMVITVREVHFMSTSQWAADLIKTLGEAPAALEVVAGG